jgi:hypothetical protein
MRTTTGRKNAGLMAPHALSDSPQLMAIGRTGDNGHVLLQGETEQYLLFSSQFEP